jgi:O-antigen/teichoic acid export membrane protein
MKKQVQIRMWLELILGSITGALFLLTLLSREWIEIVFGLDPDSGSGALEWLIVGGLLAVTITLFVLARVEWRRSRAALSDLAQ